MARNDDKKRRTNLRGTSADVHFHQGRTPGDSPVRRRKTIASDIGGRTDTGGAATVFNSSTNPELEQDPAAGGTAPARTLQQDLRRTRGRTEVQPASDPGGGAGRVRPSQPILSRRELEEQRRRASHDASSARASLRRTAGAISTRGPTRSQSRLLGSAPTAGDFLAGRVEAITNAAQPDPAQDRAQELGLRRLESDRQFATDARNQNIDLREQDVDERLGLRREQTSRRGQDIEGTVESRRLDIREQENRESARRAGEGERSTPGERVTANLWSNPEARQAVQERFGTEDRGEISEIVNQNIQSMAGRTNWEEMPEQFQSAEGRQALEDMAVLNHAIANSEDAGLFGAVFGSDERGLAPDFNSMVNTMQDFVINGETPRWINPSTSESGGRTFEIGGIPGEQQQILRRNLSSMRNSILEDNSPAGQELQNRLARNELQKREEELEERLGTSITQNPRLNAALRRGEDMSESGRNLALNETAFRLMAEDDIPRRERNSQSARFDAYRNRAQELVDEYKEVKAMDPAEYLAQIRRQAASEQSQEEINDQVRRP